MDRQPKEQQLEIHPHIAKILALPDWTPGENNKCNTNNNDRNIKNDDNNNNKASSKMPFPQVVWPGEGRNRMVVSNLRSSSSIDRAADADNSNSNSNDTSNINSNVNTLCIQLPILVRDTPESIGMKIPKGGFGTKTKTAASKSTRSSINNNNNTTTSIPFSIRDLAMVAEMATPVQMIDCSTQKLSIDCEDWTIGHLLEYMEDRKRQELWKQVIRICLNGNDNINGNNNDSDNDNSNDNDNDNDNTNDNNNDNTNGRKRKPREAALRSNERMATILYNESDRSRSRTRTSSSSSCTCAAAATSNTNEANGLRLRSRPRLRYYQDDNSDDDNDDDDDDDGNFGVAAQFQTRVLNQISYEFSGTNLHDLVRSPGLVRAMDWIDQAWPSRNNNNNNNKAGVMNSNDENKNKKEPIAEALVRDDDNQNPLRSNRNDRTANRNMSTNTNASNSKARGEKKKTTTTVTTGNRRRNKIENNTGSSSSSRKATKVQRRRQNKNSSTAGIHTSNCGDDDDDGEVEYPAVQYYCLTSASGAFTDFHIDFGGSSVWYHVVSGTKVFCVLPPTEENLEAFQEWLCLGAEQQTSVFLPDLVQNRATINGDTGNDSDSLWTKTWNDANHSAIRFSLKEGETLLLPAGWIHAVYTPQDSLVFGGNFMHGWDMGMQFMVNKLEADCGVLNRYRFPHFGALQLYAGMMYLERLRSGRRRKFPVDADAADSDRTAATTTTTTVYQDNDWECVVSDRELKELSFLINELEVWCESEQGQQQGSDDNDDDDDDNPGSFRNMVLVASWDSFRKAALCVLKKTGCKSVGEFLASLRREQEWAIKDRLLLRGEHVHCIVGNDKDNNDKAKAAVDDEDDDSNNAGKSNANSTTTDTINTNTIIAVEAINDRPLLRVEHEHCIADNDKNNNDEVKAADDDDGDDSNNAEKSNANSTTTDTINTNMILAEKGNLRNEKAGASMMTLTWIPQTRKSKRNPPVRFRN